MNLLSALNERQREAVEATDGPLLIVAGAGTGKTMVLTTRIAYLIQAKRVDPAQILAVTFTNKAAGEMKERIQSLLGSSDYQRGAVPAMGTFHSICVKILRQDIQHLGYESSFVIYDSDDSLALIKRVMRELQIPEKNFNPKAIRGAISAAKNVLQTVEDVQKSAFDAFQSKVGLVYGAYQKELKKLAALDFDDLIMKTVELFQQHEKILQKYQNRWKYLHIDEYQDTNAAQYRLIQLLASVFRNLCVVGDPDQNIYSWRGADITNILNFSREYSEARVVKLEQNYRSTPHILAGAQAVIARNGSRIEKNLWTAQVDGEKVQLIDVDDERAEAEYVIRHASRRLGRLRDQVVLYRTNAQSRVLEEACLRAGIPYKVIGGVKFYARKEIRDMVAYLRLVHNFRDDASLLRVINTPSRKIGSKTLEAVQEQAHRHGVSLFQVMAEQSGTLSLDLPETKMESLRKFCRLIDDLRESAREFSVSTLIREILHRSAYDQMLLEDREIGETRLENIQELVSVAQKYDDLEAGVGLATFLEEVALVSDTDELKGSEDYLTLMTIHSAKGLEFEQVYVVGLEEGIFPHSQSSFDPERLEEERRLMYVAMTRAKQHLHLIWARRRLLFGESQYNPPSSFLKDIPAECLDGEYLAQQGEEEMVGLLRDSAVPEEVVFSDELPRFLRQVAGSRGAYDQPTSHQNFSEGDVIEHKTFGRGTIRTLKGDIAEIEFENASYGLKKLALNVAPVWKVF